MSVAGRVRLLLLLPVLLGIATMPDRSYAQQSTVQGSVVDSVSSMPLAGATVRIVELNRDEHTHNDGSFRFVSVPAGSYTIIARRPGFRLGGVQVRIPSDGPVHIRLVAAPTTLSTVVVTGSVSERSGDDLLSPTSVLANGPLERAMDGTLAATVAGTPGVSLTSVGPATAKPVLRGLSGDRVLVLEDGQRPGDLSSTGGDHAIAVEPLTARQIEVVRGPMSLLYGSSALGGVVNVVRDEVPITMPEHAHGTLLLQGASANSSVSGGGTVTTALGPLALRGEASLRGAGDLRTPEGRLDNTQLQSSSLAGGASWITNTTHVGGAYRYYSNSYGIPGGFVGSHPEGVDIEMRRHSLRGEAMVRSERLGDDVRATVQLTDYSHEELTKSGTVGTAFVQRAGSGEAVARTAGVGPFTSGAIGVRGQMRELRMGGALRTPNTDDRSLAGFVVQELVTGPWRFQGGLRYDWAHFEPLEEHVINVGDEQIPTRSRSFGALSGSLGTLVEVTPGFRLGANVSRAYRTPDFNELYSDGPHLAAYSYDVGNPSLSEETGVGVDVFARVTQDRWRAEVAVFRNDMSNYVFPRNTGEVGRQGNRPLFQYVGRDALLSGVEGEAHVQLAERLTFEATASFVRGTVESRGDSIPVGGDLTDLAPASGNLPLMPPLNGRAMLRYEQGAWFAGVGTRLSARQERLGDFETPTAGYALLDLQAGLRIPASFGVHSVTLRLDNALDKVHRNHLSRTSDVMPESGINMQILYRMIF